MEKEFLKIRKREERIVKTIKINGDILVPDTKPDIINDVGISGNCFVNKTDISEGKIRIEGNFSGTTVYLSDIGELKTLNFSLAFYEIFESDKISANDDLEYSYKVLSKNIKILNERKINIEIVVEFDIDDYRIEEVEMVSSLNDSNIQKLEKTIVIKEFCTNNSSKAFISEDVNFPEKGNDIEILKSSFVLENIEKKISFNKVLTKAEANVSLIYLCANQIKKFDFKLPVMNFIEIEKINEDNLIDIKYNTKNFSIMNNVVEKESINCSFEFDICVNVYNKREITVIDDMYSLTNKIEFSKQIAYIECMNDCSNDIFEFNEKIDIQNVREIYDFSYYLKKIDVSGVNNYEGVLGLDIFYGKEENGSFFEKYIEIPFIINAKASDSEFKIEYCEIKSVNEEWICSFKVMCVNNQKYEKIDILSNYEILPDEKEESYSMIIYFAQNDDTLWNISKKFRVSMESIMKLNSLSNESRISAGDKIFIMRG